MFSSSRASIISALWPWTPLYAAAMRLRHSCTARLTSTDNFCRKEKKKTHQILMVKKSHHYSLWAYLLECFEDLCQIFCVLLKELWSSPEMNLNISHNKRGIHMLTACKINWDWFYGILSLVLGSLSEATDSSVGQYIKFFILKRAKLLSQTSFKTPTWYMYIWGFMECVTYL